MFRRTILSLLQWTLSNRFLSAIKVPVFGGSAEMVATGGLYNFGTDYEELGRQAARMAIRIMKGEKPGKVAVETPEKLELHTNKEMAKELRN